MRQAYEHKYWAFVTDYVRLFVVHKMGGFYFDTDVELVKPLTEFLDTRGFFCFENDENVATGLGFCAVEGEPILKELMDYYNDLSFENADGTLNTKPCPVVNRTVFQRYGLVNNGESQTLSNGMQVQDKSWFAPFDYFSRKMKFYTKNTHGIHHYDATWYTADRRKAYMERVKNRRKKDWEEWKKACKGRLRKVIEFFGSGERMV